MHLCYEQAIFNCTAAPPYLHITPPHPIAAACTTSWDDLLSPVDISPCPVLSPPLHDCLHLAICGCQDFAAALKNDNRPYRHNQFRFLGYEITRRGVNAFSGRPPYVQSNCWCSCIIVSIPHGGTGTRR